MYGFTCLASYVERTIQGGITERSHTDPEALLTVLRIAHLKSYEVSTDMSLAQLSKIATICDKYDTVATCRASIGEWVDTWYRYYRQSNALQFSIRKTTPHLLIGNEAWIWVAWVFGFEKQFTDVASYIRTTVTPYTTPTSLCKPSLSVVPNLIWHAYLPPGLAGNVAHGADEVSTLKLILITENLLRIRQATVSAQLEVFFKYLDLIKRGKTCTVRPSHQALIPVVTKSRPEKFAESCNALALGLFINGFKPFGDCCSPRSTNMPCSIAVLYCALTHIGPCVYREPASEDERNHASCDLTVAMNKDLEKIYLNIESPVLDSHVLHLQKQWAKGRTAP